MAAFFDNYVLNPPPVIIDDSDAAISYDGSWHAANETEILSAGPSQRIPVFNTLHVLQVFNGSFSYNFTGGGISVFATPVDSTNYTSQCFVDGNEVPFNASASLAQFGRSIPVCQAFGLPDDANHTISVNISVPPRTEDDPGGPLSGFALDYMLIQPPSGVSPWDNGTQDLLLAFLDMTPAFTTDLPTLRFGILHDDTAGQIVNVSRDWVFDPENGFQTVTPGSQLNLTFIGTCVWWYGYFVSENGGGVSESSVTFSIDGGAPSNFSSPNPFRTPSQELLFSTPLLPYARHSLTVVNHGNNQTSPLTLQSFVIQKSSTISNSTPTVSNSTVGPSPSTPIPKQPAASPKSKHGKVQAIVGGIAGGVVFLLFVAFGVYIMARQARRRQNPRPMEVQNNTVVEPFHINTEETARIIAPQKAQPGHQNVDNPFMQQELPEPPLTKWTRRHTILDGSEPVLDSPSARVLMPRQTLPASRLGHHIVQADSQFRLANTDTIHDHPSAQISNDSDLITASIIWNPTLPVQGARQEDSGFRMASVSDLPPLYTTH